ncbi:unnamed protein product [Angiostrongylus costaricensis]|uniref:UBIQUITIN_CONJUGAT_2 domain-containing protein n=1 Tax=Angiostrongylus costaricensis TaxID=334426 RepID=A0A158PFL4_ANGCS|nr:unnamed protein product [Angiostrongylus costaricensis]
MAGSYLNGVMIFVKDPNYKVWLDITLYHPNVDRNGDLCIPILCFDNWKPATTLADTWKFLVLSSILRILVEPDLSRAIRIDVADEFVNVRFDDILKENLNVNRLKIRLRLNKKSVMFVAVNPAEYKQNVAACMKELPPRSC